MKQAEDRIMTIICGIGHSIPHSKVLKKGPPVLVRYHLLTEGNRTAGLNRYLPNRQQAGTAAQAMPPNFDEVEKAVY